MSNLAFGAILSFLFIDGAVHDTISLVIGSTVNFVIVFKLFPITVKIKSIIINWFKNSVLNITVTLRR